MRRVTKTAFSLAGIFTVATATVLPAPKIAHAPSQLDAQYSFAYAATFDAQKPDSQTLVTALASSGDEEVLELVAAGTGVKEIPVPDPLILNTDQATEPASQLGSGPATPPNPASVQSVYTLGDLMFQGVVNWEGLKFTYYSQSVLPGGGLSIPGRHVNAGGYVSDADGFIVLAGSAPLGTVYNTPFGWPGKIYDRGTVGNHLDVYTM